MRKTGTLSGIFLLSFIIISNTTIGQWIDITPPNPINKFSQLSFPTENDGYAIDLGTNNLFKTTDGGITWSTITIDSVMISDVHFVSPLVGFVCGNWLPVKSRYTVAKTTDGGNTWIPISPFTNSVPYGWPVICFKNALEGYTADGFSGIMYKTTNGGTSWDTIQPLLEEISDIAVQGNTLYIAGKRTIFVNSNGFIISVFTSRIGKSIDGGITWSYIDDETVFPSTAIHAVNGDTVYFSHNQSHFSQNGFHNLFHLSVDGLNNISSIQKPTKLINDIYFENTLNGHMVGDSGRIYITSDGHNFTLDHQQVGFPEMRKIEKTGNTYFASGDNVILKKEIISSIDEIRKGNYDFQFYPNPVTTQLYINTKEAGSLTLYDISGRTVIQQYLKDGNVKVQVSQLNNGVYFLEMNGLRKKLIVR